MSRVVFTLRDYPEISKKYNIKSDFREKYRGFRNFIFILINYTLSKISAADH